MMKRDPVCGRRMNRNKAHVVVRHEGEEYLLCCPVCQAHFESDPGLYIEKARSRGPARHPRIEP